MFQSNKLNHFTSQHLPQNDTHISAQRNTYTDIQGCFIIVKILKIYKCPLTEYKK